ncbi:hypothetical protein BC831DRAFT_468097 [Entophlyctis helioformis]|nr:hypothetical protein BC831DRAFT_468097 [Entophlyctis helioformis]
MAGKKKKGGKGKGKGKGGKKSKSKTPKTPKMQGEPAPFLTLVMLESHKIAAAHYHKEYLKAKDESRKLREKLRQAEEDQYARMRTVVSDTDNMTTRFTNMEDQQTEFQRKLDVSLDPTILTQMDVIKDLHRTIDQLESDIEATNRKIAELTDFQLHSTEAILSEEITALKASAEEAKVTHSIEMEKLLKRHDMSVYNTTKQAERIINAVEGVASQRELDSISESTLDEERLNRRLKKQLARIKEESGMFAEIVNKLEDRNMYLICQNLQIDWNFTYLLPDDVETDPLHVERLTLDNDNDFVLHSSTAAVHDRAKAGARPHRGSSAGILGCQTSASASKTNGLERSSLTGRTRCATAAELQPAPPLPLTLAERAQPRQRYKTYEIRNVDRAIREMVKMEVCNSHLNAEQFGVCGRSIKLESVSANDLGPTKYYS